jgi:hypothetical protein
VNGFGHPTTGTSPRSSLVARHLISDALQRHAHPSTKVTNSDDPDLQPTSIILGHLPPADMLLNYHCSAFPMAILPTIEQLNNAPQPMNPATALAVNFVTANIPPPNPTTFRFLLTPTSTQSISYPIMSTNSTMLPRLLTLLTTNVYYLRLQNHPIF